jgi:tRNA G18 (ribose-2'-O)-methylase SpoU
VRELLAKTIYNRSWVLDLVLIMVLAVTIMFLVGQRNQTEQLNRVAQYNKELNTQNKEILDRIVDCTDPKGVCFQQGQDRTKDTINVLNRITLLAAYCSSKTPPYASVLDVMMFL